MSRLLIVNGNVLTRDGWVKNAAVSIEGTRIAAIGGILRIGPDDVVHDAGGANVTPGLCDIHIHGAGGHWGFMSPDDLLEMSRALLKYGVAAFCPATVSLPHKDVVAAVRAIRDAMEKQSAGRRFDTPPEDAEGSRILGVNLEGPYISAEKPGAHNPLAIRDPKDAEVDEILEAAGGAIRVATVAPEIKGGLDLIRRFAENGVVVSIGHSNATQEQLEAAVSAGARLLTHLFNAMRLFHQREPGLAFGGLANEKLCVELIADGHHVHPVNVAIAARLAGPGRLILITDAIAAAGMPEGEYSLWGFKVTVKDGKCLLPNGTFAGSVLTLNRAVANLQAFSGCDAAAALRCATWNPLRLLGLDDESGVLAPGRAADIALFDDDMNCLATYVGGKRLFPAPDE